MIAELAVIVVILITVGFIYLKGTILKSFLLFINTIVASSVAFAFFETAGRLIAGYGYGGEWIFGGSFLIIFIVISVLLNTLTDKLMLADLYIGDLQDKAIRSVIAVFSGLAIAGVILTAAAMMPIGTKWPYERFAADNKNINPTEPEKTLILNADGFITGFSSWLSRGSMGGKKSLATFHPELLNELYLNRIRQEAGNSIIAGSEAVTVKSARLAPAGLISASDNQPLSPKSGTTAVIVQAGIDSRTIKEGGAFTEDNKGAFTLAQVRLLCKTADSADNLDGSSTVVWPVGFIRRDNIVDRKNLNDEIKLNLAEFSGGTKWFDFVFYIPADSVPVMLQFKLNAVAPVVKLLREEKENTPSATTTSAP
ncbi:MAG: CvpA family protein [Phycisphaerae bacterium]